MHSVVYSPNGRHIVSGSYDTAARVQDAFILEVLIKPSSINQFVLIFVQARLGWLGQKLRGWLTMLGTKTIVQACIHLLVLQST